MMSCHGFLQPLLRSVLAMAFGCMVFFPPQAVAHEDQIAIVVTQFSGPKEIGLGVANVLKLKIHANTRSADPPREGKEPPPFGGGYYQVSKLQVQPSRHDAAEHRARVNTSQMTLWGSIASIGELVLMKAYLSIPKPYSDFRRTSHEIWKETLRDVTLSVDLPRRRIDFNLQALPLEVVKYYAHSLQQMKICESTKMEKCPDIVGEGVKFIELEGDQYARVRYPTNRFGYIYIPDIVSSAHPDIVDYASGLMALFRADWERAALYFTRIANSETAKAHTRSDALLLRSMALAKDGRNGETFAAQAVEMTPYSATALKFLIMAKLNAANREGSELAQRKVDEISKLVENHAILFEDDSDWSEPLKKLLQKK